MLIGWLTAAAGAAVANGKTHAMLGKWISAAGVALVLTVILSTGRFMLYGRRMGPREIVREDDPAMFWIVVMTLAGVVAVLLFGAIRGALGT